MVRAPSLPSLLVTSFLLSTFAPSAAFAGDSAAASGLFEDARRLREAGNLAEACPKFEASFEADPQLGALMNLADCLERDGRLASAYGRWGDAIELATRRGDDRVDYARDRRDAVGPRLSFITLKGVGEAPDLVVYKGNAKISPGAFGTALPVNPGETLIQVVRGEDVLWETKVVLAEKQESTVEIPLGEIAAQNPTTVKKRTSVGETRILGTGPEIEGFWSKLRIAGFVVGGVGVLGLGGGLVAGGLALGKRGDLDGECASSGDSQFCTQAGLETYDDAKLLADVSTWTMVGSGVVTAIGITLIIAAPNDYRSLEERAFVVPWVTPEGAGATVLGTF
jgi:hypothetical protein